jgi:hypothetical protein
MVIKCKYSDSFGNKRLFHCTAKNLRKHFESLSKDDISKILLVGFDQHLAYDCKLDLEVEITLLDGSVKTCLLDNFKISRIREAAVEDIREMVYSKTGIVADPDNFRFDGDSNNKLFLVQID